MVDAPTFSPSTKPITIRSFKRPWTRSPEFGQRPGQWMQRHLGHCVWTGLFEPAAGFVPPGVQQ